MRVSMPLASPPPGRYYCRKNFPKVPRCPRSYQRTREIRRGPIQIWGKEILMYIKSAEKFGSTTLRTIARIYAVEVLARTGEYSHRGCPTVRLVQDWKVRMKPVGTLHGHQKSSEIIEGRGMQPPALPYYPARSRLPRTTQRGTPASLLSPRILSCSVEGIFSTSPPPN